MYGFDRKCFYVEFKSPSTIKILEDSRKILEDSRKILEDSRKILEDSRKILEDSRKIPDIFVGRVT